MSITLYQPEEDCGQESSLKPDDMDLAKEQMEELLWRT